MGYLSYQGAGASSMMASDLRADEDTANANTASTAAFGGYTAAASRIEVETATAAATSTSTSSSAAAAAPPGPPPSAPWCVNEWGPDLNETQRSHGQFPMDVGAFQKELGVPLQLYAPYFCPESKYFKRNNPASKWTSVVSDTTLPGCSFYGFQDVTPDESRAYYDDMFARGQADGMASFEPVSCYARTLRTGLHAHVARAHTHSRVFMFYWVWLAARETHQCYISFPHAVALVATHPCSMRHTRRTS